MKAQSQPTKPTRDWPALGIVGCSRCGAIDFTGAAPHWCEPEKDWSHNWDTKIKYVADAERPK